MQKLVLFTFEVSTILYWIFMLQIVHFQKNLEGQCLNKNRLTGSLFILLDKIISTLLAESTKDVYSNNGGCAGWNYLHDCLVYPRGLSTEYCPICASLLWHPCIISNDNLNCWKIVLHEKDIYEVGQLHVHQLFSLLVLLHFARMRSQKDARRKISLKLAGPYWLRGFFLQLFTYHFRR